MICDACHFAHFPACIIARHAVASRTVPLGQSRFSGEVWRYLKKGVTLISGLKPAAPGSRFQVMDAQVPGFGIRVSDTGNRTFILRMRYPGSGSPSRREIAQCADITLADAREKARKWRSLVKQGIDPTLAEEKQFQICFAVDYQRGRVVRSRRLDRRRAAKVFRLAAIGWIPAGDIGQYQPVAG